LSNAHEEVKPGRRIVHTRTRPFDAYDMEGPVQHDMSVIELSYDRAAKQGAYLIRMQPGAETIAHEHPFREEFLILEGELIESDGTVLKVGDFVMYEAGTVHNSRTEKGCLLLGIDWQKRG
jgi:quercetin dioxygenase-like cupin family protein